MKHHLKKETWHIKGDEICCDYCGKPINLESEHECELHYKTIKCKCGKKVVMKVNFHGSGHDNFIKSKLEDKIKKNDSRAT